MYSLIIVDYNSIQATAKYIKHCRQYLGTVGASHVVVVENGNDDGIVDFFIQNFGNYEIRQLSGILQQVYYFRDRECHIAYCHAGSNLGYAKGNNLGAKIAVELWRDPYYVISNNDLKFASVFDWHTVDQLFAENPNVAIIGPKVIDPSGQCQSPRVWQSAFQRLIINYWISGISGLFGQKIQKRIWDSFCDDTVKNAISGSCAWVSGCFMLVRAEAFHAAGMFDEHTFLYAEEMILSKRMEEKGYGVYFCSEVEIVHNHAQTTKNHLSALRRSRIDFEANCYFYETYMCVPKALIALAKVNYALFVFFLKAKHKMKALRDAVR